MEARKCLFALVLVTVALGQKPEATSLSANSNAAQASLIVTHADIPEYPSLAASAVTSKPANGGHLKTGQ